MGCLLPDSLQTKSKKMYICDGKLYIKVRPINMVPQADCNVSVWILDPKYMLLITNRYTGNQQEVLLPTLRYSWSKVHLC